MIAISIDDFKALFEEARDRFASTRRLPYIDAEFPNYNLVFEGFEAEPAEHDRVLDFLTQLMLTTGDPAVRFVVLNYYYSLAHFISYMKEELVSEKRGRIRRDLTTLVGLRAVGDCSGLTDISWEIVNASAVRNWSRVQELYGRLKREQALPLVKLHAGLGCTLFRAAFGEYDPADPADDNEDLLEWSIDPVTGKPNDNIESFRIDVELLTLGLAPDFKMPVCRDEELVRDAKNELEKARDKLSDFRLGLRAALARCYMARGEYSQAATEYRTLTHLAPSAFPGEAGSTLSKVTRERTAAAIELSGNYEELRAFLKEWINAAPEDLGPRERLARIESKFGNYQLAFNYISEEHSRNPEHDQDWKATLLVELGTRASAERALIEAARRSLEQNPDLRRVMEGILAEYWPTFELLSAEIRDSFQLATRMLFDSEMSRTASVRAASMMVGQSVESQLKTIIFQPFGEFARGRGSRNPGLPAGTRPDPLAVFVARGKLTLGEMIRALSRLESPTTSLERQLRDWIKHNRPAFLAALESGRLSLEIYSAWNDSKHGMISREQAVKIYQQGRAWLDELVRAT